MLERGRCTYILPPLCLCRRLWTAATTASSTPISVIKGNGSGHAQGVLRATRPFRAKLARMKRNAATRSQAIDNYAPSARTQTVFCAWNHCCGILTDKTWLWNHCCGIVAVESLKRDHGCGIIAVESLLWNHCFCFFLLLPRRDAHPP